jgi:metal transporter CNNM
LSSYVLGQAGSADAGPSVPSDDLMEESFGGALVWFGVVLCLTQSAMFSGLNLAFFSLSRLQLEIAVAEGDRSASRVLAMRRDASLLLTTILWGNVGINVLLTLLVGSVLVGAIAFVFSTVIITFGGEILPQAYFSRHALRTASLFAPVLRFYQILLLPVAWPSARLLDRFLGPEGVTYFRETELRALIRHHMDAPDAAEVDRIEGMGALNFLALDDIEVAEEGEPLDDDTIITLPLREGVYASLELPTITAGVDDPFVRQVNQSGHKWVILTDPEGEPRIALDADGLVRDVVVHGNKTVVAHHCHRPIIVMDPTMPLGRIIGRLQAAGVRSDDDVIDNDVVLLWGEKRRIITGADILGRLLRGIAQGSSQPEE